LCLNIGKSMTVAAILDCTRATFSALQCSALEKLEWHPKVLILAMIQFPGHYFAYWSATRLHRTTQPLASQGCSASIITGYHALSFLCASFHGYWRYYPPTVSWPNPCYRVHPHRGPLVLPRRENTGCCCAEKLLAALARQVPRRDE